MQLGYFVMDRYAAGSFCDGRAYDWGHFVMEWFVIEACYDGMV